MRFFAQSGRLDVADDVLAVDQRKLFEGNSVLRGQTPRVSAGPGGAGQPGA